MEFTDIFNQVSNEYVRMFGELKYQTISDKIDNSNKITRLINESRLNQIAPNHLDFVHSINEITYFIFAKGETQAMGCLFALFRWVIEVNDSLKLVADWELEIIALNILKEMKSTFSYWK